MNIKPLQIETHSIDWIPPSERQGKPRSLFYVWFAANTSITALVTGALFVITGNSVLSSIVSIIIGNVIGGFITSLHSAQGPRLGVPQMIQSRAQFGYYGAILPLILALFIYIGFYATGLVLGGEALSELFSLGTPVAIVLFALLSTILAIAGYRWIHTYSFIAAILVGIIFVWLLVVIISGPSQALLFQNAPFKMAPFVLGISLSASWQLTFGPYIADYSRYLPENTSPRKVIAWTFAGSVLGASLAMIVGACAAQIGGKAFSANPVSFIASEFGQLAWLCLIAVAVGKLSANTLSSYGGYMSLTTIVNSFTRHQKVPRLARIGSLALISLIAILIAVSASNTFLSTFNNFLLFLLYFITPWSAINLVDFYFLRHGRFNIPDLFRPHGVYGLFSWKAYISYFIGIFAQIPFINSSYYTGPIAKTLDGAEVAWIIGLLVTSILYWLLRRMEPQSNNQVDK